MARRPAPRRPAARASELPPATGANGERVDMGSGCQALAQSLDIRRACASQVAPLYGTVPLARESQSAGARTILAVVWRRRRRRTPGGRQAEARRAAKPPGHFSTGFNLLSGRFALIKLIGESRGSSVSGCKCGADWLPAGGLRECASVRVSARAHVRALCN